MRNEGTTDDKEPEDDPSVTGTTGYKNFVIDSPAQKNSVPRASSPDNDEFRLNEKKSSSDLNPAAV